MPAAGARRRRVGHGRRSLASPPRRVSPARTGSVVRSLTRPMLFAISHRTFGVVGALRSRSTKKPGRPRADAGVSRMSRAAEVEIVHHDFERMYLEHRDRLFAFLVYRTGDRSLAEDLLGDVF